MRRVIGNDKELTGDPASLSEPCTVCDGSYVVWPYLTVVIGCASQMYYLKIKLTNTREHNKRLLHYTVYMFRPFFLIFY